MTTVEPQGKYKVGDIVEAVVYIGGKPIRKKVEITKFMLFPNGLLWIGLAPHGWYSEKDILSHIPQ